MYEHFEHLRTEIDLLDGISQGHAVHSEIYAVYHHAILAVSCANHLAGECYAADESYEADDLGFIPCRINDSSDAQCVGFDLCHLRDHFHAAAREYYANGSHLVLASGGMCEFAGRRSNSWHDLAIKICCDFYNFNLAAIEAWSLNSRQFDDYKAFREWARECTPEQLGAHLQQLPESWRLVSCRCMASFDDVQRLVLALELEALRATERIGERQATQGLEPTGATNLPDTAKPETVVSVDLSTNSISLEGCDRLFVVQPHQAHIVHRLVEDKLAGEPYTTGEDLLSLRGCSGKNISREIRRIKTVVPPLVEILRGTRNGYCLTQ